MERSTGNKINTAVFISGRGSNLKSLIAFSIKKKSPIRIKLVISNNKKAKGLNYIKNYKLNKFVENYSNIKKAENNILKKLKKSKIEFICLAGFMKILSSNFIKRFNNPILNIHPSLLPKYKGLNTHLRVINNNETFTGATVHLVTEKLDSGKIILQKKVKVFKNDDEKTLSKRVLKVEHQLYPKAIIKFLN